MFLFAARINGNHALKNMVGEKEFNSQTTVSGFCTKKPLFSSGSGFSKLRPRLHQTFLTGFGDVFLVPKMSEKYIA